MKRLKNQFIIIIKQSNHFSSRFSNEIFAIFPMEWNRGILQVPHQGFPMFYEIETIFTNLQLDNAWSVFQSL